MSRRKADRQRSSSSKTIDRLVQEGQSFLEKRRWTEAETVFKKVLEGDLQNLTAHDKLGVAAARRGEYEYAESWFNKMLSINPRSKKALNNIGNLYLEKGDPEKAMRCYEKAIQIDGNYSIAYHNLSAAYKKMGDLKNYVKNNKIAARIAKHERRRRLRAFLVTLLAGKRRCRGKDTR